MLPLVQVILAEYKGKLVAVKQFANPSDRHPRELIGEHPNIASDIGMVEHNGVMFCGECSVLYDVL